MGPFRPWLSVGLLVGLAPAVAPFAGPAAEKAPAWRETSAFRDGAVFLATEQYELAERCFERVVKEFPGCHEAWTGLGYARLMLYCDRLTPEEVREYGVGPVLTGGFCRRIAAQEPLVRGRKSKLWWAAVEALNEGLRQKPNRMQARAALGLAYLFHPDGKDTDRALELLQGAADAAKKQAADRTCRAVLLLNLGAAWLAAGAAAKGLKLLDEAEALGKDGPPSLAAALRYHRGMALAAAEDRAARERALDLLEAYLKGDNPLSVWWPLAYERYARLCAALGREPADREALRRPPVGRLRPAAGVRLASGQELAAGDEVAGITKKLGAVRPTVVVRGTNLARWRFDKHPLELLVTDRVLAVCLVRPGAPPLTLGGKGSAGKPRVGMTRTELDRLLGREYRTCELPEAGLLYRFYPEQGIAVRLVKGKATELIVVQVPGR
jgi:hypothetical protein